jgi:SAM-dependent methyltransferase
VVGLDFDAVKLAKAREECAGAGLGNVEFQVLDVRDWSEVATYDVAYGRFILSHLSDRSAMLARMCAALRPNGLLILEDIDFTGAFCYPPNDAFDRYCELYRALIRRRDGDADLGARLYRMCLDAGLNDVLVQLVQPVHGGVGAAKGLTLSTMVNIADGAVAEGLAMSAEVETLIAALTAYTEDARSIVGCPRIFQVWGRRSLTPART